MDTSARFASSIVMGEDLHVSDKLVVRNNTLGDVLHYGEEKYLSELNALILRPYDAAVMLDDAGIDYRNISDFQLFMMVAPSLLPDPTIFLPGITLGEMKPGVNPDNGEPILYHPKTYLIIDRFIHEQIVSYLRAVHFLPMEVEHKVANEMARQFLLRNMRSKQKIRKRRHKAFEPQYPQLISSLVNNAGFKYDYDNVFHLKISQFWDAFYRLNKIQSYNNTMLGVYTGNIDAKKIDMKGLSWFGAINLTPELDQSKAISPT